MQGSRKNRFSAAVTAGVVVAAAFLATAPPAQAQGWNVSQGTTPSSDPAGYWALTYAASLRGALYGIGACNGGTFVSAFTNHEFDCYGWYERASGLDSPVRNNAHSLASTKCYGATTWYSPNAVGNYNWVSAHRWGTLNSALANDNASAGRGNLC